MEKVLVAALQRYSYSAAAYAIYLFVAQSLIALTLVARGRGARRVSHA